MSNTLVTSIRVNERIIQKLDEHARSLRWYKRNSIIEAILFHFLNTVDLGDLKTVLRASQSRRSSIKIVVEEVDPYTLPPDANYL